MSEEDLAFSNEMKALQIDEKEERKGSTITPFMVAESGSCTFVTKVRNMEEIGVAVGIVIDDKKVNVNNVVMSDDGSGAGIRIPSMLIGEKDGDKLLEFLKNAT